MTKWVEILASLICTVVILLVDVPVLANTNQDIFSIQSAMEYLLVQDVSDNVKISFQMDGKVESIGELMEVGTRLSDQISQLLLKEGKELYQSSGYPYTDGGFWLNYWYDESLGKCIVCVLNPTENKLTVEIFQQNYEDFSIDWCKIPFGLSYGNDRGQIEAAIKNMPYYYYEENPDTIYEDSRYIILAPGIDQIEYIQLNATSYLLMQNMKIQADEEVIIPISNYLYQAIYYMKDTNDTVAQKNEVAKILAQQWDGNWTDGYERGNWQYYMSTTEYLGDDPLLETEFWGQWGREFSLYCSVSVGETMVSGHSIVKYNGKGVMPIELLQSWHVK